MLVIVELDCGLRKNFDQVFYIYIWGSFAGSGDGMVCGRRKVHTVS